MKKFTSLFSAVCAIGMAFLVATNAQYIGDTFVALQYQPSGVMKSVISDLSLTPSGERMMRVGRPVLSDRTAFNNQCQKRQEQSIVLGCYLSPYNIYVYDVNDDRLQGVRQVTTAHEMLHVAYDRLSQREKARINQLIEAALPSVQRENATLAERLKIYAQTEPGERDNELHSILGTEAHSLPAELESYYAQYFKDRKKIVGYADQYSSIFAEIKSSQDKAVSDMEGLAREIDTLTAQYNQNSQQLNSDIEQFNQKAAQQGGFDSQQSYQIAREELLSRQAVLESDRSTINAKIDNYNTRRQELEALNIQIEKLKTKLDSTSSL